METAPSVLELGALLLAAVAAGWLARRLGLPAVIGYLVLGIAVSPFTPGFVADREQLQLLADVGVVLLLFEVGIEVDLWRLRREHGRLVWAAPLQVVVTTLVSAAIVMGLGLEIAAAAVVGLAIALSSSVVIVNITRSRRRTTDRPTEVALLGWSVVQDVTGVVLAAVVLATLEGEPGTLVASLAGFAAFAGVAVVTALVLPRALGLVRAQPDLFLLLSVASGLVLAGIGSVAFDVPLALAAFIGGLAITEDPISREARRQLLPFRDLFAVLFFVAIGALIDPRDLATGLGWLVLFLALIVGAKVVPAYVIARLAGIGTRPLQLAIGLGQVGEFTFVLVAVLAAAGAIASQVYVAMIAAVAISIGASTILVRLVPRPQVSATLG
ncbi:MAG TPA: cation:proton antiporter [Candidatus Limnocylindrales bacterium]|nr:cation:proton antiporter [Candidatus Limnocylindrales bacterium]